VRLVAVLLVLAAASCAGHHHEAPAVSRDGRAVLQDAYDGRLDRQWSCGSLRAAYARLPVGGPTYSPLPGLIGNAAGAACDEALDAVGKGAGRARVEALLGQPDRRPRCWLYRWTPRSDSAQDGARICFAGNRVSFVQVAVHG
jgi:hypothetical protein